MSRFLWTVLILGLGMYALQQPHTPREQLAIAVRFIEAVRRHDFSTAYGMTTGGVLVGVTMSDFQRLIEREGLGRVATDSHVEMRLNRIAPFQSYGNRLRRFLTWREVDPDSYRIDHVLTVSGAQPQILPSQILPFEVRLIRGKDHLWRIDFFQVHAM